MKFIIKGVTSDLVFSQLASNSLHQYSFDLRPKSFNFTQLKNIKNIISKPMGGTSYSIMFENEKDFVIRELLKELKEVRSDTEILLEFTGNTGLSELEKFDWPYVWHYHSEEKIKNIASCEHLKRIVFNHNYLEELNESGELYGFFQLFSDYTKKIDFEILIDWNSEIILSIFEFFTIPIISFELDSKVELSYQNPNYPLIKEHLGHVEELFANRGEVK